METEPVRDQREIDQLLCDQKLIRQVYAELMVLAKCVWVNQEMTCINISLYLMQRWTLIYNFLHFIFKELFWTLKLQMADVCFAKLQPAG